MFFAGFHYFNSLCWLIVSVKLNIFSSNHVSVTAFTNNCYFNLIQSNKLLKDNFFTILVIILLLIYVLVIRSMTKWLFKRLANSLSLFPLFLFAVERWNHFYQEVVLMRNLNGDFNRNFRVDATSQKSSSSCFGSPANFCRLNANGHWLLLLFGAVEKSTETERDILIFNIFSELLKC